MSTLRSLVRAIGFQALGGLATWAVVAVVAVNVDAASLDLVSVLLLFGQLVIVPLGLLLIPAAADTPGGALARGGRVLFRIGGLAALAALVLPRGELSAAVAALYLLPALLVGASALLDAPRTRSASGLAGVAARLMLLAGALLFVLHRQDVAFASFPELALHLASVHLHFVGFGVVVMAGSLARRRVRLGTAAAVALVVGSVLQPFGAAGGPVVLGGLLLLVGGTFSTLSDPDLPASARRLLFISVAVAIFVGALAGASIVGRPAVDIGSLVRLHGSFAAIGFALTGLIGWRLAERSGR